MMINISNDDDDNDQQTTK